MIAGLLTSIICGIIGSLVVVNRIVFISAGTAHTSYGGIGLAFFLGWPVLETTLGFSILIAALVALLTYKNKHHSDAVIGVIWAGGMAFGIILIDLTPGYQADLMSYLFGSILAVSEYEIQLMFLLTIAILTIIVLFYRDFLAMSYDEEFARIKGLPVNRLYFLLLIMISFSVVISIRSVGLIMVIALLTISPMLTMKFTHSLRVMMYFSVGMNLTFVFAGLFLSLLLDLSSGALIITVAVIGYILISLLTKLYQNKP